MNVALRSRGAVGVPVVDWNVGYPNGAQKHSVGPRTVRPPPLR